MPKVGQKHFAYTKKGYAKAKKMATRTGQQVKYRRGGITRKRQSMSNGTEKLYQVTNPELHDRDDLQKINVESSTVMQPMQPFFDWLDKIMSREKGIGFYDWLLGDKK